MAVPGQETAACEEGEEMDNDATSFDIVIGGGGNGSIQAAQGRQQSIAAQGCGAQQAGPIERQQRAPLDGWGDNLDSGAITENNACWWRRDQEDNQIKLHCNAMTTTAMTKGADDHDKEDPPKGGKTQGGPRQGGGIGVCQEGMLHGHSD